MYEYSFLCFALIEGRCWGIETEMFMLISTSIDFACLSSGKKKDGRWSSKLMMPDSKSLIYISYISHISLFYLSYISYISCISQAPQSRYRHFAKILKVADVGLLLYQPKIHQPKHQGTKKLPKRGISFISQCLYDIRAVMNRKSLSYCHV